MRHQGAAAAAARTTSRDRSGTDAGDAVVRAGRAIRAGHGADASVRRAAGQSVVATAIALSGFDYVGGELCAERIPLSRIAADFGTPCYVYSRAMLEGNYRAFDGALAGLPHQVCYAMKANGNLAVLDLLARQGCGFDIVSG